MKKEWARNQKGKLQPDTGGTRSQTKSLIIYLRNKG